jgi:hypothetical protein
VHDTACRWKAQSVVRFAQEGGRLNCSGRPGRLDFNCRNRRLSRAGVGRVLHGRAASALTICRDETQNGRSALHGSTATIMRTGIVTFNLRNFPEAVLS